MHLSHLSGIIEIPQSGAEFYTLAGEAKTVAQIFLAPGGGLSRYHRQLAEAHPFVSCNLRGDSDVRWPAPSPEDFHQATLRWAIRGADYIAIWSATYPQCADDVGRWGVGAADEGAHFVTTIETNEDRAPEWAALIERWKRKDRPVALFSSVKATGGSIQ